MKKIIISKGDVYYEKTITKLLTALLTLCIVLTLMPMTAFADPETHAVKFYPGDHGNHDQKRPDPVCILWH